MKFKLFAWLPASLFAICLLFVARVKADELLPGILIPAGSATSETYAALASLAVEQAAGPEVRILIVPAPLAVDGAGQTEKDRADRFEALDQHRMQLEGACRKAAGLGATCTVSLAPVFDLADAGDPGLEALFLPDLAAILLFGDPPGRVGLADLRGTFLEAALDRAYRQGIPIAASGAAGSLLARPVVAGLRPDFSAAQALDFGAAAVEPRGLAFGLSGAYIEPAAAFDGEIGLLLNTLALSEGPHLGIALAPATGLQVKDAVRLERVFGRAGVTVLDAATYHSADTVQYHGPGNTLSLRNVLVHQLAPGDFTFELDQRRHSLAAPAELAARSFAGLAAPRGAGPLLLSVVTNPFDSPVLTRFVNLSGGTRAKIAIVAAGYPSSKAAIQAAAPYAAALGDSLGVETDTLVATGTDGPPLALPEGVTGLLLLAGDLQVTAQDGLAPLKGAWLAGLPLLVDGPAVALAGAFYSFPQQAAQPGLGLLPANIEPHALQPTGWERLFRLAYAQPGLPAIGLPGLAALEFDSNGGTAIGQGPVLLLDLRTAQLAQGTNGAAVIANGLLDVFAPGEFLRPAVADMNALPVRRATPVLIAAQPTLAPTATASPTPTLEPSPTPEPTEEPVAPGKPTRTPRPTATPPVIPPSADPSRSNMMIVFGVLAVCVVLVGVWINRDRTG